MGALGIANGYRRARDDSVGLSPLGVTMAGTGETMSKSSRAFHALPEASEETFDPPEWWFEPWPPETEPTPADFSPTDDELPF